MATTKSHLNTNQENRNQHHFNKMTSDNNTQSPSVPRYEQLKKRKLELEERLAEKCNQLKIVLAMLSEESHIIGLPLEIPFDHSTSVHKKVNTNFKLNENLINKNSHNDKDEQTKLILEKNVQMQISEASFRLANDVTQIKSIRRTHKQNFESAQQKLAIINQNLSILQNKQQQEKFDSPKTTQDDLSLHKIQSKQLHLHVENQNGFLERHNSMKTSSMAAQKNGPCVSSLSMPSLMKGSSVRPDHNNGPILLHKQATNYYYQQPPQCQQQQHYLPNQPNQQHIKLKKSNSMIDKNLLSLQNGQQAPINMYNNVSLDVYHKHKNIGFMPVDESYRDYYLMQVEMSMQQNKPKEFHASLMEKQSPQYLINSRQENMNVPFPSLHYHHQLSPNICSLHKDSPLVNRSPTQKYGLGGYWITSNSNEKIWCAVDNKNNSSSLDRKTHHKDNIHNQFKPNVHITRKISSPQQPVKSTSLGNFDVLNLKFEKPDHEDTISIATEIKKREKVWCETALDSTAPAIPAKNLHYQQKQLQNQHFRKNIQKERLPLDNRSLRECDISEMQTLSSTTSTNIDSGIAINDTNVILSNHGKLPVTNPQINLHSPRAHATDVHRIISPIQYLSPIPNTIASSSAIQIQPESPVLTVVEQGKIIMPYKEITKPFEMSDFYKYSTKYRQKQGSNIISIPRHNDNVCEDANQQ